MLARACGGGEGVRYYACRSIMRGARGRCGGSQAFADSAQPPGAGLSCVSCISMRSPESASPPAAELQTHTQRNPVTVPASSAPAQPRALRLCRASASLPACPELPAFSARSALLCPPILHVGPLLLGNLCVYPRRVAKWRDPREDVYGHSGGYNARSLAASAAVDYELRSPKQSHLSLFYYERLLLRSLRVCNLDRRHDDVMDISLTSHRRNIGNCCIAHNGIEERFCPRRYSACSARCARTVKSTASEPPYPQHNLPDVRKVHRSTMDTTLVADDAVVAVSEQGRSEDVSQPVHDDMGLPFWTRGTGSVREAAVYAPRTCEDHISYAVWTRPGV